ncbi:MAG: hypothetical protein ACRC9V_16255, partial [Aeromonas sp.]
MHRHHKHPEVVNAERIEIKASRRKLWNGPEDNLLIESANLRWRTGMKKAELYTNLRSEFPARSEEAIKRRRLFLKWQPDTRAHQAPTSEEHLPLPEPGRPTIPIVTPTTPAPTHRNAGTKWTSDEEDLLRAA